MLNEPQAHGQWKYLKKYFAFFEGLPRGFEEQRHLFQAGKQENKHLKMRRPGAVARSEACSLGMQAAPSSIPTSGTFFRGDLVMKTLLRPFSLFR